MNFWIWITPIQPANDRHKIGSGLGIECVWTLGQVKWWRTPGPYSIIAERSGGGNVLLMSPPYSSGRWFASWSNSLPLGPGLPFHLCSKLVTATGALHCRRAWGAACPLWWVQPHSQNAPPIGPLPPNSKNFLNAPLRPSNHSCINRCICLSPP